MKLIPAVCLALVAPVILAAQPRPAAPSCDRECLRGVVSEVLYSLIDDDTSRLPVSPDIRITEDAIEKTLDKIGLVRSVTRLRGYRQDIIDERAGQAVAGVMVEEAGAPVILVVRVKVDGEQRISELEFVTTRSRADGMIFSIDTYSGAPARAMNYVPKPSQLDTREKMLEIAMLYPKGLSNAKTFNAVGLPFSKDAYRIENGALMAGPGCTFNPGCNDIGNQSLQIFERLGKVTVRDYVIDERLGIVMLRLSWNQRGPGSDRLTAWEMFKVYDGQMHMVEAYIRLFPPELDLGGWPIRAGIAQP
jgi:hypothetical protein